MLWLGLVVGAAGLIFDRSWGYRMIVVASLGLAFTATWNALDFWNAGIALPSLMNLLSAMILVALALCVYRIPRHSALPFPSTTARAEQPDDSLQRETSVIVTATETRGASSIRRLDRAYLAFTWCAAVIFLLGAGEWFMDPDVGQVLFMLLWFPVMLLTFLAIGTAVTTTLLEWWHRPLWIMAGTLGVMILVSFANDKQGGPSNYSSLIWYVVGTMLIGALAVRWFIIARHRTTMDCNQPNLSPSNPINCAS
jgi:hypothetical protein